MPPCETLLTGARLADGRQDMAIAIEGARIAAILPPGAPRPEAGAVHSAGGDLVLPALTDGHIHLDKTLFGLPWRPHQAEPFRMSRIETDQATLLNLPLSTEARAGALIRRCATLGTGHLRTHVDITPAFGLKGLEGVIAARAVDRASLGPRRFGRQDGGDARALNGDRHALPAIREAGIGQQNIAALHGAALSGWSG